MWIPSSFYSSCSLKIEIYQEDDDDEDETQIRMEKEEIAEADETTKTVSTRSKTVPRNSNNCATRHRIKP